MQTEGNIRIVIADDHSLFRAGLRLILSEEEIVEIVGEAANGVQAIDIITDLKPDVVLLDLAISEMDGNQILTAIKQTSPETKALMFSAAVNVDEEMIFRSLKLGAKGYLSKNLASCNLIKAIKAVQRGEMWIERKLMSRFFSKEQRNVSSMEDQVKKTSTGLTAREQEVLSVLTKGLTNKEIADTLCISEKTVKTHLNNIFRKLNVTRRLQAILYAIGRGII
ncbi:MAG: response regulator [Nitrospinales bacterium]